MPKQWIRLKLTLRSKWNKFMLGLSRLLKDFLSNVASHDWSRSKQEKWREMLIQNKN